jgi:hypothetical protein
MQRQPEPGARVRFRALDAEPAQEGRVRKALHILDARRQLVPVYIVESNSGETLILGDGEILEELTAAPA